jgi:hypothetical protein
VNDKGLIESARAMIINSRRSPELYAIERGMDREMAEFLPDQRQRRAEESQPSASSEFFLAREERVLLRASEPGRWSRTAEP